MATQILKGDPQYPPPPLMFQDQNLSPQRNLQISTLAVPNHVHVHSHGQGKVLGPSRSQAPHHIPCASLKSGSKHRNAKLTNGANTISCVYIDKNGVTTATWSKDGERRTAAERLGEGRANYVKTDRVLDTRQALKHSHGPHVVTCQHPPVYTKGPLKQMHSAPGDGLPRDPHGSSPDLHLARRALQDLQRFRVLQQMVEAQAHLQAQHSAALYQNSQRVPLQSGTPHQNLRHSPPIIPVSRRYASSSQPPLNRHPIVGVVTSSSQRRSPPVLQRGSPPHLPQLQQQQQQQQQQPQQPPTNHCLYHNSSSPDCLALLFGNGVPVNPQLPLAPQSLDSQFPRTSTPHTMFSADNFGAPLSSTPVHSQTAYPATLQNSSALRTQMPLQRVPSARLQNRPKSPSPGLRTQTEVGTEHPIRRSASYTERQLRKCIGRTAEEIRDLEQQLRELIISSASITDQPTSVEEGLAEILGDRIDVVELQEKGQATEVTDKARNSPPSVSRSTNTPPSRHSSDPEKHLRSAPMTGVPRPVTENSDREKAARRTRSQSNAPSASSSSDSGHASHERQNQQRRSTLPRARSASRLRPASPSSESSTDGSEYFKPRSRTTSDYISRSSSFRSPGRTQENINTRSLGRSKSDAATFAAIPLTRGFKSQPNLAAVQPLYTLEDTAMFFDTMGFLDTGMYNAHVGPSPITTPPKYFESQSSQDSNNNSNENPSECESEEELNMLSQPPMGPPPGPGRIGLSSHDLIEHAGGVIHETSIVEKNARVIKWLYNCRKSMQQSVVL